MHILYLLIFVLLFVVLTPGVLVTLPPKSSKLITAITHGVIFAIILALIHKFLWKTPAKKIVTFKEGATTMNPPKKPEQSQENPVVGGIKRLN